MENLTCVQKSSYIKLAQLIAYDYDFEKNLRYLDGHENEDDEVVTESESKIVGSTVEITVRNCVSTIADVDRMHYKTSYFAFFDDPDDKLVEKFNHYFYSENMYYKISPDKLYAGYVNVHMLGLICFSRSISDLKEYEYRFVPRRQSDTILRTDIWKKLFYTYELPYQEYELRGPARKNTCKSNTLLLGESYETLINDDVYVLRCLTWPPEASEWMTRRRKYDWPDKQTIKQIVDTGCHIVPVAHDDCKSDVYQWRISFSEAEAILMKSLSPKQQHIYNFLRYFIKKEIILEEFEESGKILSTYMIKTLMLWHCEQKSAKWWRNTESIEVCCYLLKTLLNWLKESNCRNYFIPNCNLFPKQLNSVNANCVIQKLTESTVAGYLNRYMDEYYLNYKKQESNESMRQAHAIERFVDEYHMKNIDWNKFWRLANSSEIREPPQSFLLNASYISCMILKSRASGLYAPNIDSVNVSFIDYYKAHVMLQVAAIRRTHKKHELALGMLCSLFVDHSNRISPIPRNSSTVQMISRQYYYELAKQVLIGRIAYNNTDHFVAMKLANILMIKELKLVGINASNSRAHCLRLHLAAINSTFTFRPNNNTFSKVSKYIAIEPPDYEQSNDQTWIDGRYLLFNNDIVVAVALQNLIKHVKSKRNIIVKSIPISLTFLRKYLFYNHEMSESNDANFDVMHHCTSKSSTDTLVAMLMQLRLNHTLDDRANKSFVGDLISSSGLDVNGSIQVSYGDDFENCLIKCAVIRLTSFHENTKTIFIEFMKCGDNTNIYKALYWYKEKKYDVAMKLCKDMLQKYPTRECATAAKESYFKYMYLPTCFYPFQEIFDSDSICLAGLILMINKSFRAGRLVSLVPHFFDPGKPMKSIVSITMPQLTVYKHNS